jgi:hypothetical protein
VGEQKDKAMILDSRLAFDALFDKLHVAALEEAISIRVINPA